MKRAGRRGVASVYAAYRQARRQCLPAAACAQQKARRGATRVQAIILSMPGEKVHLRATAAAADGAMYLHEVYRIRREKAVMER